MLEVNSITWRIVESKSITFSDLAAKTRHSELYFESKKYTVPQVRKQAQQTYTFENFSTRE